MKFKGVGGRRPTEQELQLHNFSLPPTKWGTRPQVSSPSEVIAQSPQQESFEELPACSRPGLASAAVSQSLLMEDSGAGGKALKSDRPWLMAQPYCLLAEGPHFSKPLFPPL